MRRAAIWLAVAWALGVAAYFLIVPAYGSSTSGLAVVLPVLVAALPLAARGPRSRRTLSAVGAALLGAFTVLGAASVGLFYAPAAAALALAAAWPGGASSRPAI